MTRLLISRNMRRFIGGSSALVFLLSGMMGSVLLAQQWGYQGQPADYTNTQSLPPLQGRVMTAPAGSFIQATLQSPISSEFSRVGDRFMAVLGNDLASGGSIVLPSGSQLEAQVVSVTKAGRTGRNGVLDIRFTSAILPNGQRVPISARIQTEDGSGVIRAGTTGGRIGKAVLKTGLGAGLGAALGTAMGPLSGGEVGRGAIYGTAIGGGIGALTAAWQKGNEATIPAGQPVNIVLDQPLTISPGGPSYPSPYSPTPSQTNQFSPQPYSPQPYSPQPYSPQPNNPYGY